MKIAAVLSISGMILDVLGAVVLARSFVLKRPTEVFRDLKSLGVWDFQITRGARDMLLSWLIQSLEARTGAGILATGFTLQAVSQFVPAAGLQHGWVVLSLVGLLSLWAFLLLQKWFVRLAVRQALPFYVHLLSEASSEDWKREIPARQAELEAIRTDPGRWLAGGDELPPLDRTLTSN